MRFCTNISDAHLLPQFVLSSKGHKKAAGTSQLSVELNLCADNLKQENNQKISTVLRFTMGARIVMMSACLVLMVCILFHRNVVITSLYVGF